MNEEINSETMAERHITSIVVQVEPLRAEFLRNEIQKQLGGDVHLSVEGEALPPGKLIVCLETETLDDVMGGLDAIKGMSGVFNAALVFHQLEDADLLDEELCN